MHSAFVFAFIGAHNLCLFVFVCPTNAYTAQCVLHANSQIRQPKERMDRKINLKQKRRTPNPVEEISTNCHANVRRKIRRPALLSSEKRSSRRMSVHSKPGDCQCIQAGVNIYRHCKDLHSSLSELALPVRRLYAIACPRAPASER